MLVSSHPPGQVKDFLVGEARISIFFPIPAIPARMAWESESLADVAVVFGPVGGKESACTADGFEVVADRFGLEASLEERGHVLLEMFLAEFMPLPEVSVLRPIAEILPELVEIVLVFFRSAACPDGPVEGG